MAGPHDSETRVTLLGRLQRDPANQGAWAEFVEHYGRRVYDWCRKWKLQEADAEDVTQTVLLKLADKMKTFAYDPSRSFRGWLKTVTHNAWVDFQEGRARGGRGSGDSHVADLLNSVAAREDLLRSLEEQFDHELLEEASALVPRARGAADLGGVSPDRRGGAVRRGSVGAHRHAGRPGLRRQAPRPDDAEGRDPKTRRFISARAEDRHDRRHSLSGTRGA